MSTRRDDNEDENDDDDYKEVEYDEDKMNLAMVKAEEAKQARARAAKAEAAEAESEPEAKSLKGYTGVSVRRVYMKALVDALDSIDWNMTGKELTMLDKVERRSNQRAVHLAIYAFIDQATAVRKARANTPLETEKEKQARSSAEAKRIAKMEYELDVLRDTSKEAGARAYMAESRAKQAEQQQYEEKVRAEKLQKQAEQRQHELQKQLEELQARPWPQPQAAIPAPIPAPPPVAPPTAPVSAPPPSPPPTSLSTLKLTSAPTAVGSTPAPTIPGVPLDPASAGRIAAYERQLAIQQVVHDARRAPVAPELRVVAAPIPVPIPAPAPAPAAPAPAPPAAPAAVTPPPSPAPPAQPPAPPARPAPPAPPPYEVPASIKALAALPIDPKDPWGEERAAIRAARAARTERVDPVIVEEPDLSHLPVLYINGYALKPGEQIEEFLPVFPEKPRVNGLPRPNPPPVHIDNKKRTKAFTLEQVETMQYDAYDENDAEDKHIREEHYKQIRWRLMDLQDFGCINRDDEIVSGGAKAIWDNHVMRLRQGETAYLKLCRVSAAGKIAYKQNQAEEKERLAREGPRKTLWQKEKEEKALLMTMNVAEQEEYARQQEAARKANRDEIDRKYEDWLRRQAAGDPTTEVWETPDPPKLTPMDQAYLNRGFNKPQP